MNQDLNQRALHLLQTVFGYPAFRGQQADIVDHVSHGGDALAVFPADCQDGAGLDGDLEDIHDFFRDILGKVEQAAGQDQMPRGRNRQEFGETFDQPHDDGF